MVQGDHLDEVWRAALAASGDQHVAATVTTAVLLWYSRFPIGPGAAEFAGATAYDRAWDARFRGRPVITLCPYVLAGEDAEERIAHLDEWHDAVLDPEGRIAR